MPRSTKPTVAKLVEEKRYPASLFGILDKIKQEGKLFGDSISPCFNQIMGNSQYPITTVFYYLTVFPTNHLGKCTKHLNSQGSLDVQEEGSEFLQKIEGVHKDDVAAEFRKNPEAMFADTAFLLKLPGEPEMSKVQSKEESKKRIKKALNPTGPPLALGAN